MRFFVHPIFASGHYQTATTLGQELIKRNHEVIIYAPEEMEKRVSSNQANKGFMFIRPNVKQSEFDYLLNKLGQDEIGDHDAHLRWNAEAYELFAREHKRYEKEIEQILDIIKPDVVLLDHVISVPTYIARQVPWVQIISMNVLSYGHPQLPPKELGLSVKGGPTPLWDEYNKKYLHHMQNVFQMMDEQYAGYEIKRQRPEFTFENSNFLNLYCKPQELDYFDNPQKWGDNFVRFDTLVRQERTQKKLNLSLERLQNLPGKLIYLSLGTLVSTQLTIMQSVMNKVANVKHRFIVSKGECGDELKMPPNSVGENFLPQTQVLQMVDVFISHGGNNSFLEGLHFGTPMVLIPGFVDQYDNATRLEEQNLGKKLPLSFTSQQLQEAIDDLISDEIRLEKIRNISERCKKADSVSRACDLIEQRFFQLQNKTTDKENSTLN